MLKKPVRSAKSDAEKRDFQEQKNHQDFVYGTNQTLQDLGSSIKSLTGMIAIHKAKSESDHTALMIQFENFKDSIIPHCRKVDRNLGDIESKISVQMDSVLKEQQRVRSNTPSLSQFEDMTKHHEEQIQVIRQLLHKQGMQIVESMNILKNAQIDRLEIIEKTITSLIETDDPFPIEIESRMCIYEENFKSLYKEMTDLKLAFGCVQKKFEHACRIEKHQEVNK